MKDIRCAYPQEILIQFFFGITPFYNLEIWPKLKILLKEFVSTIYWNRSTEFCENFVVMKDKICRYAFLQKTMIWSFSRSNLYPFWTLAKIILCNSDETGFLYDCPSLMLGIAIRCIQHSQAMLERGVCELPHFFFHFALLKLLQKSLIVLKSQRTLRNIFSNVFKVYLRYPLRGIRSMTFFFLHFFLVASHFSLPELKARSS